MTQLYSQTEPQAVDVQTGCCAAPPRIPKHVAPKQVTPKHAANVAMGGLAPPRLVKHLAKVAMGGLAPPILVKHLAKAATAADAPRV